METNLSYKEKCQLAYARKVKNKKMISEILDKNRSDMVDERHQKARQFVERLKDCRKYEDRRGERRLRKERDRELIEQYKRGK